jgi:hypothetical protein
MPLQNLIPGDFSGANIFGARAGPLWSMLHVFPVKIIIQFSRNVIADTVQSENENDKSL